MAETYIQTLNKQIKSLDDGFDLKEIEIAILKGDIEDLTTPHKILGEQAGYLLEMLSEVLEFEKKKPSDRIRASKRRLIDLLDTNTQLNKIVSYNHSLRLLKDELVAKIQILRVENKALKQQIENIIKAEQF